jgi:hypothetical protein
MAVKTSDSSTFSVVSMRSKKIWKRIGNWDESKAATAIPSVGMRSVQVAPRSVFSGMNRIKPLFSRGYVSKVQEILFAGKATIYAFQSSGWSQVRTLSGRDLLGAGENRSRKLTHRKG